MRRRTGGEFESSVVGVLMYGLLIVKQISYFDFLFDLDIHFH